MKNKSLSLTIGIPTYYGGPGLVQAVKSILRSENVAKFRLIVSVDANPLKKNIHKQLKDLGVEIIDNKERGGQVARIKQIISLTKTDILITTQDDIRFAPNTISQILKVFTQNSVVNMVGARLKPEPATSLFELILEIGTRMTYRVGALWNQGDNYLLCSGRCLAYKTKIVKKFTIPNKVINSDAYLYFENKRLGGQFKYALKAVVFNKSPKNMTEHLKQSKRFQDSQEEISQYLNLNLEKEYTPPISIKIRALIETFLRNPILTLGYITVFIYTRIKQKESDIKSKGVWQTDVSTKRI